MPKGLRRLDSQALEHALTPSPNALCHRVALWDLSTSPQLAICMVQQGQALSVCEAVLLATFQILATGSLEGPGEASAERAVEVVVSALQTKSESLIMHPSLCIAHTPLSPLYSRALQ